MSAAVSGRINQEADEQQFAGLFVLNRVKERVVHGHHRLRTDYRAVANARCGSRHRTRLINFDDGLVHDNVHQEPGSERREVRGRTEGDGHPHRIERRYQ